MMDTSTLPLDLPTPALSVRPGPVRPRGPGWHEEPDVPKMVGMVHWEATMTGGEMDDTASFAGSVE